MGSLGFRLLLVATATIAATPTPSATPPPQIYRVVSRPLCSELRQRIKPAIGMIMENDATIRKSPDLFKQYNTASLYGGDPASAHACTALAMGARGLRNS